MGYIETFHYMRNPIKPEVVFQLMEPDFITEEHGLDVYFYQVEQPPLPPRCGPSQ